MNSPTTRQKVGLGIAAFLNLANVAGLALPTPDGEEGPPLFVLVLGAALGVIGLVAVYLAWRKDSRRAIRVVAGTLIINTLLSLPAFFVDGIPDGIRILVGVATIITIVSIVLMFSSARRSAPVLD